MNKFNKLMIPVASLLMLAACNTNDNAYEASDVGYQPRNVYTQDNGDYFTDRNRTSMNRTNRNEIRGQYGGYGVQSRIGQNSNRNGIGNNQGSARKFGAQSFGNQQGTAGQGQGNQMQGQTFDLPRDGVVKIRGGIITIDPNSYSTSTPSGKFPHSEYISQGQFKFYKPGTQPGGQQGQQGDKAAAPNQQTQTPTGQTQQPNQQTQTPTGQNQQPTGQQPGQEQATPKAAPTQGISSVESRVIELTNAERRKNGLQDLKADPALSNVAREKSRDMQQNKYFSHTSPTHGSPFDMMRDFGISYKSAGENIAQGQRTPEEVVKAWMNSEGHRKNILTPNYTHIGVGYVESGNYWTQMFVGR
ncbi:CAP domain-containing protein [Bacillus sp. 31A1R]|uniref:CAP domain-containing protein n=1 Tax=Robertmurraya mangrovi TaxID=3098077 RepID=A0ABU5J380_9BACI|nr:CAP domain-containing protein [Bacillus sp. 31A1R]MDZ5473858.1 CAP domain-containing protein [Bacillus sp. 31A1R]